MIEQRQNSGMEKEPAIKRQIWRMPELWAHDRASSRLTD